MSLKEGTLFILFQLLCQQISNQELKIKQLVIIKNLNYLNEGNYLPSIGLTRQSHIPKFFLFNSKERPILQSVKSLKFFSEFLILLF